MTKFDVSGNLFTGAVVVGVGSVPLTLMAKFGFVDGIITALAGVGVVFTTLALLYLIGLATRVVAHVYLSIKGELK